MNSIIVEQLGEWNPQLFRELKGQLKPRNLLLVAGAAFISQLLLCLFFASRIPAHIGGGRYDLWNSTEQIWEINWELWSLDIFTTLSLLGIFMLLGLGTHLLISDLAREERQGTLNFIRFSPQSAESILWGKILGVPILLYLFAGLALPLHLASGLGAGIPSGAIAGFYLALLISCAFFYSAALLYTLLTFWLKGFQSWLGSGAVLLFLSSMFVIWGGGSPYTFFAGVFAGFSPTTILPHLIASSPVGDNYHETLMTHLELGQSIGIVLAICSVGNYWVWQGLKRRFHNPNATVWSKTQSYWLCTCYGLIAVRAVLPSPYEIDVQQGMELFYKFAMWQIPNLFVFIGLIFVLSPHRAALQNWSRHFDLQRGKARDLIVGENSPAIVAVAINYAIISAFALFGSFLSLPDDTFTLKLLALRHVEMGLLINGGLILIYASIVQWMLLMKSNKRAIWATATIGALTVLPLTPVFNGVPVKMTWVFTPIAATVVILENVTLTTVGLAVLGQWLAIALINLQITRQLQKLGASDSKSMLNLERG
jgi:hypothetical protein